MLLNGSSRINRHVSKRFQRTTDPFVLQMWTIYERPRDFPDVFVVREWRVVGGRSQPGDALSAPTLEEARELVPLDCVKLARSDGDDPKIVETWI